FVCKVDFLLKSKLSCKWTIIGRYHIAFSRNGEQAKLGLLHNGRNQTQYDHKCDLCTFVVMFFQPYIKKSYHFCIYNNQIKSGSFEAVETEERRVGKEYSMRREQ